MSLSSLLGLTRSQPTQIVPASISEPKIAEEIAPYLKDILGKGQALYKQRMDEGFVPYEGKTLAAISDDQTAAQAGLRDLVGQSKPIYDEATGLIRGQTEQATAENLQPFMNPYQQARLLSDLQAKGDLAAFQNAQKQFEAQKLRERQAASGLSSLVPQQFTSQARELGALEAMGREQQQREQTLLDESYKRFLTEREYPEQQLGKFQALVAGTPINQGQVQYTQQQYRPSPLATALGTGATALGTYDAAKNLKLFSEGGSIDGGLSGLPVVKKKIGQSIFSTPTTPAQMTDINEEIEEYDEEDGPSTIDSLKQFFNSLRKKIPGEPMQGIDPKKLIRGDVDISPAMDTIKKIGTALNPLRTTEKQKQRVQDLEGLSAVREGIQGRIAREQQFEENQQSNQPARVIKDLESTLRKRDRMSSRSDAPDVIEEDFESNINTNNNNQSVTNNNQSVNKQNQELISGDIIGNARPGTGDTRKSSPYDAVREQFTNLAQQYAGLEATAKAQGEADKARLTEEKETARKAARSKFLIDLGKGLLTGDGKGGGFFAEFGKAGAKATEGSQEYLKTLKDLNREERQIVRDSANQQFQARVGKYQQLLNKGKIDIQEYTTGLEQMRLNHAAKDNILKTGLTLTEQADNYLASTEDGKNPNVGYENYLEIRYLLKPSQQKAYDARFKAIFDENPNEEEFKVKKQP